MNSIAARGSSCGMTRQETARKPAQFDMFADADGVSQLRPVADLRVKRGGNALMDEAEMLAHLTATGRYRILQKLEPREIAKVIRPEFPLTGIILDTETTGLNHRKDEIIEIILHLSTRGDRKAIVAIFS
jgi:DNA polymerase-3 subunit epsilon